MNGDYWRYIAEITPEDSLQKSSEIALSSYLKAVELSNSLYSAVHPVSLSLALNTSVLYFEIKNDPHQAVDYAEKIYNRVANDVVNKEEDAI